MTTRTDEPTIPLAEFFQQFETDGKKVWVAIMPMTEEQARRAYRYRPHSRHAESRWCGNNLLDDFAKVINGLAKRCKMCQAPTESRLLFEGACPDCSGIAELYGQNPHVAP